MGRSARISFTRLEMIAIVAIVSIGLTALAGVRGAGDLGTIIFIIGILILLPLIFVLGERFPLVDGTADAEEEQPTAIEELRLRYATGAIGEDEFDHRLGRLLETESSGDAVAGQSLRSSHGIVDRE